MALRQTIRPVQRLISWAVVGVFLLLASASECLGDTATPLLVMARGQSNMAYTPPYSWTVPPNLHVWNSGPTPGDLGTAFVAANGSVIGTALAYAQARAEAEPDREVYLVNVSYSGIGISHWMAGAPAPDMYAWLKSNVEAALKTIRRPVELVDLEWQGETDAVTGSTTWAANFANVRARLRHEAWYPADTTCIIMGLTHRSLFGPFNVYLMRAANEDPARTIFVDTGLLPDVVWDISFLGPHMQGAGYWAAGHLAYAMQVQHRL